MIAVPQMVVINKIFKVLLQCCYMVAGANLLWHSGRREQRPCQKRRLCGIVFDAMSIKESLHYDRASDFITGREECGESGKSLKLANHALVLLKRLQSISMES